MKVLTEILLSTVVLCTGTQILDSATAQTYSNLSIINGSNTTISVDIEATKVDGALQTDTYSIPSGEARALTAYKTIKLKKISADSLVSTPAIQITGDAIYKVEIIDNKLTLTKLTITKL